MGRVSRALVVLGWLSASACAKHGDAGTSGATVDRAAAGEAQAKTDLAAGKATIQMSSGIARYPLTPDYDAETGLPFTDNGCIVDQAFQDAYNGAVRSWVKDHGPPKNSLKARVLDAATIDAALAAGVELKAGSPVKSPSGIEVGLADNAVHVAGGAFKPLEKNFGLLATEKLKVAFADNGAVLLAIEGAPREGFSGKSRLQIDPACSCLLVVLR